MLEKLPVCTASRTAVQRRSSRTDAAPWATEGHEREKLDDVCRCQLRCESEGHKDHGRRQIGGQLGSGLCEAKASEPQRPGKEQRGRWKQACGRRRKKEELAQVGDMYRYRSDTNKLRHFQFVDLLWLFMRGRDFLPKRL